MQCINGSTEPLDSYCQQALLAPFSGIISDFTQTSGAEWAIQMMDLLVQIRSRCPVSRNPG